MAATLQGVDPDKRDDGSAEWTMARKKTKSKRSRRLARQPALT